MYMYPPLSIIGAGRSGHSTPKPDDDGLKKQFFSIGAKPMTPYPSSVYPLE